ncbi:hypothetical protein [Psychromicrobium sp. YIM B11713]|uniref:hypothetical protein n=1 Tax=Psychromicrobium sp. YIM B11713 TaxID=3145233 RepID=UPI00374E5A43
MSYQSGNFSAGYPGAQASYSYGRSLGLVLWAAVGAVFFGAIVTVIGLAFLPTISIPMRQNRPLISTLSFGAGALVLLLVLLFVVWRNQFKVMLDGSQVTIVKAFRQVGRFDARQAVVTSHVLKQSTNGIPTSTTRTLIIQQNGLEQRFVCKQFSRKTFSEMVARLRSFAPVFAETGSPMANPEPVQQFVPQVFRLDPDALRGRIRALLIVASIALLVAVISGIMVFNGVGLDSDASLPLMLVLAITGALALGLFIALIPLARLRSSTPRQLAVDPHGIGIDDQYFAFAALNRVQATPSNYGINQRNKLRLQGSDGRNQEYTLGINQQSGRLVFAEYGAFIAALQAATATRPGLLIMDLQ